MNTETDQTPARVSEAQVHQIADAMWDDMIGVSRSAVRNVLRDLFVAAGIEAASRPAIEAAPRPVAALTGTHKPACTCGCLTRPLAKHERD